MSPRAAGSTRVNVPFRSGPPTVRPNAGGADMEVVHPRCSGLDVHKKSVVACVMVPSRKEVRTFGTVTAELLRLGDWLQEEGVTHVAMESTGVYWKPVFNVLETTGLELLVVNAQHVKSVRGRKTD